MHTKVEIYFSKQHRWLEELRIIREIIRSTALEENYKWSTPIDTYQNR